MEKFENFYYNLLEDKNEWEYQIFDKKLTLLDKSREKFKNKGIALYAVIGHITLIELDQSKKSFKKSISVTRGDSAGSIKIF
jgi:hypothetical protein